MHIFYLVPFYWVFPSFTGDGLIYRIKLFWKAAGERMTLMGLYDATLSG